VAITPDGKRVYVANNSSNDVSVIDTLNNTVMGFPIPVGSGPAGVAITPDGKRVYVTNINSNDVSVIDTLTNTVVGSPIPVGHFPYGVAITPDGKRVYVANGDNSDVSVINTLTNTVMGSPIPVGFEPYGVAITPDGKRVYVTNVFSNDVSVIDTLNNTVMGSPIPAGLYPYGVAITPDGKRVYVTNVGNNDVSVINTLTNTVVTTIPVGNTPAGMAITPLPLTNFSAFKVNKITIDQRHGYLFVLSNFALGKDSNGINPMKEVVTLKIGNVTMTIPADSFHKNSIGLFTFVGQIDNMWIEALITPLGQNRFGFQAAEYGADLSGIKNSVSMELTIGNDRGITSVKAIIKK
jgi:YVTN family beta-propeller protein